MSDELLWLLITTVVALAAGGISGWVSAAYRRREQRKERIREEVLRWANPILGSVKGLTSRLANILDQGLHVALDPEADEGWPVDENWAIDRDYALESTLFVFAEYFAWVQLLHERMSFELFASQRTKDEFFAAIWKVSGALSHWPKPPVHGAGRDTQVFVLQQRAIGELLIVREGDAPRVLAYPDFLAARKSDARFKETLAPLEALLSGLKKKPKKTKRWQRLENTRGALVELEALCNALLGLDRAR
jgi:hypothetical protein